LRCLSFKIVVSLAQPAGGAALPADLALVSADAVGFVHIRCADLWKSEMFAELRKTWEKAGPSAIGAIEKQIYPPLSTLKSASFFAIREFEGLDGSIALLSFSAPFDPEKVASVFFEKLEKKAIAGKTIYGEADSEFWMHFPDERHIMVGMYDTFEKYVGRPVAKNGPMATGIAQAAAGKHIVVAVDPAKFGKERELAEFPPEARTLWKAKSVLVTLDLGPANCLDFQAIYPDVAVTMEAEKAFASLADMGRAEIAKERKNIEKKLFDPALKNPQPPLEAAEGIASVFALGSLNRLEEMLTDRQLVKRDGNTLTISFSVPKEAYVGAHLRVIAFNLTRVRVRKSLAPDFLRSNRPISAYT
jgi:hypothetical protein